MFRAFLQRQSRLGGVICRQLSTRSLAPTAARSTTSQVSSRVPVTIQIKPSILRQTLPRFYSSESTATQDAPATENAPEPGLVTRFADLKNLGVHDSLVRAITDGMKYQDMTPVQTMTISPALAGTDLVAQAKTGTGKTLAFLIPVFQRVLMQDPGLANRANRRTAASSDIRAIIMSPTRELAEQIGVEARKLAANSGIVVQTAVGGTRKQEALQKMRREGCHILVATPGRLQDLLEDERSGVDAPNLACIVLDEADRMLDVGFSEAIQNILNLLPPRDQVDRQTLLFSATIPRNVVRLAKSMVRVDKFEFVQTIDENEAPTHEKVPQHLISTVGYEQWLPTVYEIADKGVRAAKEDPSAPPFKAIVFFSNTATVQFASDIFKDLSLFDRRIPVYDIHSKLTQPQRTRSAEAFRRAQSAILISSDVTARGMDFPNVSHVIQVGLPPDRDQYIHRVGRTGRAGNSGEGWLILAEDEIAEARDRLPGLPIQPNTSMEAATHTTGKPGASTDVQRYFEEISQLYRRLPRGAFAQVYSAMLGQKFGRNLRAEEIVGLLNGWCMNGMGWTEPPALSERSVRNRGLNRIRGIRVGKEEEEYERQSNRFDDRSFGRGGSFQRGGNSFQRGGGSFKRGGNSFQRDDRRRPPSFEDRFGDRMDGQGFDRRDRAPRSSF